MGTRLPDRRSWRIQLLGHGRHLTRSLAGILPRDYDLCDSPPADVVVLLDPAPQLIRNCAQRRDRPLVIVTFTYPPETTTVVAALAEGADSVSTSPAPDELAARIRAVLRRRSTH